MQNSRGNKKTDKKAVDIVLLPDQTMMEKAIEANAELVKRFGRKIVLNKDNCLPHISLTMGCIDERNIGDIKVILEEIAEKRPLGDLRAIGIRVSENSVGEKVSVFEVEKQQELQLLHEDIMLKLAPYLSGDATADMIYADGQVAESTLQWIKEYREKSSFASFLPHITIGYGQINKLSFPIKFAVLELALCHLGNHCTCRKILASVKLKQK